MYTIDIRVPEKSNSCVCGRDYLCYRCQADSLHRFRIWLASRFLAASSRARKSFGRISVLYSFVRLAILGRIFNLCIYLRFSLEQTEILIFKLIDQMHNGNRRFHET
jgi:hypothetical protein